MNDMLASILWAAVAFLLLLLMQRWIHRHLHGVSMLLTGRPEWAVILYALVLLPGVFLHELSHWVSASLLGVRTGAFSLIPRRHADGSVILGYVEYYKGRSLGPIRESVIGGAPLIVGTAVILVIGMRIFDVRSLTDAVQSGDLDQMTLALQQLIGTQDILVWLYLLFAISNAMMPSAADRRAWPAFLLIMAGAALLLAAFGLSDALLLGLAQPAGVLFGYLGLAFTLAVGVDLLFMLLIGLLERVVGRLRGASIQYGPDSG